MRRGRTTVTGAPARRRRQQPVVVEDALAERWRMSCVAYAGVDRTGEVAHLSHGAVVAHDDEEVLRLESGDSIHAGGTHRVIVDAADDGEIDVLAGVEQQPDVTGSDGTHELELIAGPVSKVLVEHRAGAETRSDRGPERDSVGAATPTGRGFDDAVPELVGEAGSEELQERDECEDERDGGDRHDPGAPPVSHRAGMVPTRPGPVQSSSSRWKMRAR